MSVFTTALKHTSDHNFSLILIECDWNQHAALCIAYSKVQQRPGNPDSPCQVTRSSSGLWCHYLGSASAPMLRAQGFELSCPGMVSGQCWAQQQPFWDPKAVGSQKHPPDPLKWLLKNHVCYTLALNYQLNKVKNSHPLWCRNLSVHKMLKQQQWCMG